MRLLITGGCGFIGTNFIQTIFKNLDDVFIVNIDKLTYAGNLSNLSKIESTQQQQYLFIHGDISNRPLIHDIMKSHKFDAVINFAAESHVDRSIIDATPFITTNILGTQVLLDVTRSMKIPKFIHISTDEVYGTLGSKGKFTESTPLAPNSPYSASKASADMLVRAAHETYGLHTVITRCSNNYGPYQFPEKLIPLTIHRAQANENIPIYGDGMQVRDWIHVEDHCHGILLALTKGLPGSIYNFGGDAEKYNVHVVKEIVKILGKTDNLIKHVPDRLGHDQRYAMDFSFATKELGYKPKKTFNEGLLSTIQWYASHTEWVKNVTSGAYKDFVKTLYGAHL